MTATLFTRQLLFDGVVTGMVYGLVALGYFLLCYPLSLSARYLERRLHASA